MNLDVIEASLLEIEGELQQVLQRRERILKNSRDVILACSRSIIAVHSGKMIDARTGVENARKTLEDLRKDGGGKGGLTRYLVSPETEFVEASTVLAIAEGKPLPSRSSLGVSSDAYLLGLLDMVGELKRLLLVSLSKGEVKKAEQYFGAMDQLYALLSSFAVFDNVVNGVRRKIDVARSITEDARGLLAEEARRESLLSSIGRLQRNLNVRASGDARRRKKGV